MMATGNVISDAERRLLKRVDGLLASLEDTCGRLRYMQDGLAEFLAEYYDRVGAYAETLGQFRQPDNTKGRVSARPVSGVSQASGSAAQPEPELHMEAEKKSSVKKTLSLDAEMHRMFRSMVKACHPDIATSDSDRRRREKKMKALNEAHSERQAGALAKIWFQEEWKKCKAAEDRPERYRWLATTAEKVAALLAAAQQEELRFTSSREFALQQRVFTARLRGEDLIAEIVNGMQQEIALESRRVAYRRFRQQLLEEAS